METILQSDEPLHDHLKVIHHIDQVTLYDYGYEKSGSVKGDSDVYLSFLNRILHGDLVEESNSHLIDQRKKDCFAQIAELEKKLHLVEIENVKIEEELLEKEKDIDGYRKQL